MLLYVTKLLISIDREKLKIEIFIKRNFVDKYTSK